MPRNASGEFYFPTGTKAEPGEIARSEQVNARFDALGADANTARPVTAGGTGSTTGYGARQNLNAMSIVPLTLGSPGWLATTVQVSMGTIVEAANLRPAGLTSAGEMHRGSVDLEGKWRSLGAVPANGATLFVRVE